MQADGISHLFFRLYWWIVGVTAGDVGGSPANYMREFGT